MTELVNTIHKNDNSNDNSNHSPHFLLSDHPEYESGRDDYLALHKKHDDIHVKAVVGIVLYFVVFIVIFPIILKTFNNEELFLAYLSNVDLLATVLSFKNGPFNSDLFRYLYIDSRPLIGYFNQNIINYVVLLAVSYTILTTSVKSRNVSDGMAKITIILIATYLFPGRFVSEGMHFVYDKLVNQLNMDSGISWNITFLCGLLISVLFILIEAFAIKTFYKSISKFYEKKVFKFLDFE